MNALLQKLDRFPLSLWAAFSLLAYIALALWFPLLPYYNQLPLSDVRSIAPSLAEGLVYAGLVCLLFTFFAMAYRRVRLAKEKLGLTMMVAAVFLFSLPLLLVYPINANDLYRYVIRGRIQSVYGADPFSVPADSFPDDPFLPLAGEWAGATSPYGPLWELTSSTITRISGDSLLLGMLAFKLLAMLAFVGSALLLWMIFSPAVEKDGSETMYSSSRAAQTLLWAWNPALFLIFVANGHNDALMIFCLLLGYYVIHRGHAGIGFLLMMLGALVKPIGVLALPLLFVGIWRERPALSDRLRFLVTSAAGGFLLALVTFLPYDSPLELAQRLLQEATAGASFSPLTTLILISQALDLNLAMSILMLARITTLLFLFFALWLIWKSWRGRSVLRGTADIFFGYLLQALNFRIWYAAWPFPWLLLDAGAQEQKPRAAFLLRYGIWFLLTTQLSVILYGHIRVYLLDGSQMLAHVLGMVFVFILPWLLARLGWFNLQD